jgi:hypothetical protein
MNIAPAFDSPSRFPCEFVDAQQVRCRLVIAEQDQHIAEQRRRTTVTPVDVERTVIATQIARPHRFPCHIQRDNLSGAEPGIDPLAVGYRTCRREIMFVVNLCQFAFGG